MLGERLSDIGEFIMWNTDGSEILIPRNKEAEYQKICDEWCELTGIELEHDEYEAMWIKDVNNYIAKFVNGKIKRKGMFAVYEDYIGNWSKNPSGLIIAESIQKYLIDGIDPSETITNWDNIHDFLYGMKGSGSEAYSYILCQIENNIIVGMTEYDDRAIRYYASTEGGTMLKWWKRGKKAEVGIPFESAPGTKGQQVKILQHVRDKEGKVFRDKKIIISPRVMSEPDEDGKRKIVKKAVYETIRESKYPDLDYNYYIAEAWKWINLIETPLIPKKEFIEMNQKEDSNVNIIEDVSKDFDRSLDWLYEDDIDEEE